MKILFITGTRADFGKLKSLLSAVRDSEFQYDIFATGMHTQARYGLTHYEIEKSGFRYFLYMNHGGGMDDVLANTISGLGKYVKETKPNMIVVHGDRGEALAGAVVGSLNNILVAHIEGGELSGTVDNILRHTISKLAHIHFVANDEAKHRLEQMGESNIFVIGSPDIDIMLSDKLPSLDTVRKKYGLYIPNYSIFSYHPVTTELDFLERNIKEVCEALVESARDFVVIYPNNDSGCEIIMREIERLPFRQLPSMRFEHFLTMLKNAECIVGNSSAGVREAPVYGVPAVNIGTRQNMRADLPSIINVKENKEEILSALKNLPKAEPCLHFGEGKSAELFIECLRNKSLWDIPKQKVFIDR